MPSFTPPTYDGPTADERHPHKYQLFRHYRGTPSGYTVLIESGVATPYPGMLAPTPDRIRAADAYFRGGCTHTVTAGEQTILQTAGYTVV